LLVFTGRGHMGLATQLAEQAFSSSAAFAASFSVLAQIRACKGEIDAALKLYNRGIELSDPHSEFRAYLMVLRLNALLAAGDRRALDAACAQLYAHKAGTRKALGLFYAAPGPLPDDLRLLLDRFDASHARRAVSYVYYITARLYQREDNRENILHGVVSHMTSRFGPGVVPHQVWQAAPRLRPQTPASPFPEA